MTTIEIRGTIVDAWFDADFFRPEIESGLITPSSRFRAALADALAVEGETVEILINSNGGDVFAGSEMLAAIQDAGERVERIVVGGLAASMAANIALMSGRPLAVHTNSLLYFHSAASALFGGPGAHADEAEMLETINAPMIAKLVAAGFDADRVREGFEDGRNFVVGAQEAGEKLRAEVIGAEAAAPAPADPATIERIQHPAAELSRLADYTATLANVAKLAAWAPGGGVDDPATPAAEPEAPADGGGVADPATDAPADGGGVDDPATHSPEPAAGAAGEEPPAPAPIADEPAPPAPPASCVSAGGAAPSSDPAALVADLEKQRRAIQSAAAKKHAELTARAEKAEKALADATAERDALAAQLAQVTAALERERTARADLVADVLAPESDTETPASATPHLDRYAALPTLAERLAYADAHRREIAAETAAVRRRR